MATNVNFEHFVETLDSFGIQELLIFLLIFVIFYAILQKTKVLGDGKKNLNVVVALVVGALVIVPHVLRTFPPESDPVEIIKQALPQVSLVVVAIIFLLILIGVFGQEQVFLGMAAPGWITIFSLIIIIAIFGGAAGWWSNGLNQFLEDVFGEDILAVVVMLVVFGMIISWVTSEGKDSGASLTKKVGVDLDKLYGKGGGGH